MKLDLDTDRVIDEFGYLTKNLKGSIYCVYYHVLFLIRRASIVASVHLLHDFPYVQASISSVSCLAVISIAGTLSYNPNKTFL